MGAFLRPVGHEPDISRSLAADQGYFRYPLRALLCGPVGLAKEYTGRARNLRRLRRPSRKAESAVDHQSSREYSAEGKHHHAEANQQPSLSRTDCRKPID